jgi:hypothetical protein
MSSQNINRALRARHPLDTQKIYRVVGRVCVGPMSSSDVERLWEVYSHDLKADSGWVPVMDETLLGFENWLRL